MNKKIFQQNAGFAFLFLCIAITLFFLGAIIYFIAARGINIMSWEFLTQAPRKAMTEGGVAPAIIGTFYLTAGSILFALPLGVA